MSGQEIGENLAHDNRFRLVDDHVGRAVGSSGDAAVAVGDLGRQHLTGPGPIQLTSTSPFGEFGPFVFCDHALDLDQQAPLGIIERRGVREAD